jgi:hypothetical protein
MLNASNGTASVAFQFARRWTKAAILWVMGKGEVINDASGNPMKLVGTVQDITL